MTQTAVRTHDNATIERDTEGPDDQARVKEFPRHRSITAHVTDGLDGVLRVATMLRARGYRVRDLSVDVREGVVESVFTCIIALSTAETGLLLDQLRGVPVVVSAHCR